MTASKLQAGQAFPDIKVPRLGGGLLQLSKPSGAHERPFAEPGLFVINHEENLQMVDISNVPFARPDLQALLKGLRFIRNLKETFPVSGSLVPRQTEQPWNSQIEYRQTH